MTRFDSHVEAMKVLNFEACAWLEELDQTSWVRDFQNDLPKCDILANNNYDDLTSKYFLISFSFIYIWL
jgi:hypothetical protein